MFERFTDRARRVVVLAQDEAKMLNHHYIGTEHLLLGLIHEAEGVAAETLLTLGIGLDDARTKIEEIIGRGEQSVTGHIPFTPRAKKVLELGLREALRLGHNYIGTEHLLLGVVREGDGVAAQVLVKLGLDLARIEPVVLALIKKRDKAPAEKAVSAPDPDVVMNIIAVIDRKVATVAVFNPDDEPDEQLAELMRQHQKDYDALVFSASRITTLLNRRTPSSDPEAE